MSTTRIQLALNVSDVAEATAFYEKMFGVPPHKVREGYANFAIEDPPLKLVLIEKPDVDAHLNHLGVEAATAEDVASALQRFQDAGLETAVAEKDVCCHASQEKVFVTAPDVPLGWWEFYTISDDNPANPDGKSNSVCAAELRRSGQRRKHLLRLGDVGAGLRVSDLRNRSPVAAGIPSAGRDRRGSVCSTGPTARRADVAHVVHVISSRRVRFPPAARHRPDSARQGRSSPPPSAGLRAVRRAGAVSRRKAPATRQGRHPAVHRPDPAGSPSAVRGCGRPGGTRR